jgi:hypothetical protein
MTLHETADAMRRVADAIDKVTFGEIDIETGHPRPMLDGESAVGGAVMLTYLRDMITCVDRERVTQEWVLVLLETIGRDMELFPTGTASAIWQAEDDE